MLLFAEHAHPALFARLGRRLGWLRDREEAERLLDAEIAAHRADPDGRQDVLALLLGARDDEGRPLSDLEVRDQLVTLLAAGHETTAATLAWALERLVRHPEALARVRDAVRAGDGDAELTAVLDETLRVRPVVDQVGRKLSAPVELGGHRLPAGTIVAPSIVGVQRSPDAFADPAAFRPERFAGASAPPSTLIPFGGGARRCIGASFAMLEMRTILRVLLEQADLQPTTARDERRVRWRRFTTIPGRGARVVLR
jgi:cytochrome P450